MNITVKLLLYVVIFILILKYITNNENLIKDENISQDVEYNLNDYLNDSIRTLDNEEYTDLVNHKIQNIEKHENRRHAMLLEQIKRLNKTNTDILKNQFTKVNQVTEKSLLTVEDDDSFTVTADGINTKNIKSIDALSSGMVSSLTCLVEDSEGNGYIGKYTHSKIKNDDIFSIEHEINNSNIFKATFVTETGILQVTNLTGTDINNLHVTVKKMLLF